MNYGTDAERLNAMDDGDDLDDHPSQRVHQKRLCKVIEDSDVENVPIKKVRVGVLNYLFSFFTKFSIGT